MSLLDDDTGRYPPDLRLRRFVELIWGCPEPGTFPALVVAALDWAVPVEAVPVEAVPVDASVVLMVPSSVVRVSVW